MGDVRRDVNNIASHDRMAITAFDTGAADLARLLGMRLQNRTASDQGARAAFNDEHVGLVLMKLRGAGLDALGEHQVVIVIVRKVAGGEAGRFGGHVRGHLLNVLGRIDLYLAGGGGGGRSDGQRQKREALHKSFDLHCDVLKRTHFPNRFCETNSSGMAKNEGTKPAGRAGATRNPPVEMTLANGGMHDEKVKERSQPLRRRLVVQRGGALQGDQEMIVGGFDPLNLSARITDLRNLAQMSLISIEKEVMV